MKPQMILEKKSPAMSKNGKWITKQEQIEVTLMCSDGKWAMVRRKGCVPFVVEAKDLKTKGLSQYPTPTN